MEEDEVAREELKMPKDLVGGEEYDEELDDEGQEFGELDEEVNEEAGELADADDDVENEIFGLARENKEMDVMKKKSDFANQDMIDKIEKIEDQMMDQKKWQMQGEIMCKDRDHNGLLEEYLDFDTATKLPPQITQETTNQIEALIKQRILDELFDDPVRKEVKPDGQKDEVELQFTKGKSLDQVYEDDYVNKLLDANPDVFNDLTGADSVVKKEIEDIFSSLMKNLNQLSNIHFVPKRKTKEASIRTQNVPALTLEEALPIGVSQG